VIRDAIAEMASHAAYWLARRSLVARTVTIKVRYSDFTTITRSQTAAPTHDEAAVVARAVQLLERTEAGRRPVRLLGVSVHNFCGHPDVVDPVDRLPFDDDSAENLDGT
jgi:DNA polymerase-4